MLTKRERDLELALWVKSFAIQSNDLSSVSKPHVVEEENCLLKASLQPPHRYYCSTHEEMLKIIKGMAFIWAGEMVQCLRAIAVLPSRDLHPCQVTQNCL